MPLEIVPSIDLRDGKVVRLKQGDYSRQVNYDVDPLQTTGSFKAAGAGWMHIVDLDGAKEGRPVQTELISKIIGESRLQVEVGGGVRSTRDVQRLLDAGAARVVVGTKAIEDWPWFEQLAHEPAMERRLVLAIDAKEGEIATRGWTETSSRKAVDVAAAVSDWPLAALLYTDVSKDGMLQGPNLHYTRLLAESGKVPVIASGGVGNIEHLRQLRQLPIWGAIVGRSLYEGTVNLAEAIRVAQGG
ncbi:MAG TPA: 1-(5-phosphoribosyl)-5-[(5-phosphoribosylamino)methylideneamino]imidazole-4-carboxamide isomerase [Tepidisphaeraceae bacterium]|nr:1-(5-phosphoribosyl)-5-[(5-phosphoribosylamino)methylideneamino]imidazole-4-carboxamide isomerase [Tepidisphaeraceae bacterium]